MPFTREQKKAAYQKLDPRVQDFIMSSETSELIDNYLKEVGLSEDQSIDADLEILYALYGLQNITTTIDNIAKISNKSPIDLIELKKNLEINVFDKIPKQKNNSNEIKSSIGQSFENVILNQAKAMMPALEEGEEVREVDSSEQLVDSREDSDYIEIREKRDRAVAPSNLPTENRESESKLKVPKYTNNDPYREPLE